MCIRDRSERTPAKKKELRIFNQIMETFTVNELAELTKKVGNHRGHDVEIKSIPNPRKEAEEHYYNPAYQGLKDIGVTPHYLTEEVMDRLFEVVEQYRGDIRKDVIFKGVKW